MAGYNREKIDRLSTEYLATRDQLVVEELLKEVQKLARVIFFKKYSDLDEFLDDAVQDAIIKVLEFLSTPSEGLLKVEKRYSVYWYFTISKCFIEFFNKELPHHLVTPLSDALLTSCDFEKNEVIFDMVEGTKLSKQDRKWIMENILDDIEKRFEEKRYER